MVQHVIRTAEHESICVCHLHKWLTPAGSIKGRRVRAIADEELPAGDGRDAFALLWRGDILVASNVHDAHSPGRHEDLHGVLRKPLVQDGIL